MCFHSLHDIGSIIYQARTHKCQTSLSIATMSALDWRQRLLMGHKDANDHYVALGMLYEARQAGQLLGIQLGEGNFKGDGKGKGVLETRASTRQTALNWGLNWRQRLLMGHKDANDHYVALGMLYEARQAGQLLGIQLGEGNFKGDGKGKGVLETRARTNGNLGDAIFGSSEDQPELPGIQDGSVRNVSKYKAEWLKAKQKEITKKAQYLKARAWARANAMPTRAKAKAKAPGWENIPGSRSKRRWKLCGMCPNCQAARQEHDYSQDGQLWDYMYENKEEQEEEEEEEEAEPVPDL